MRTSINETDFHDEPVAVEGSTLEHIVYQEATIRQQIAKLIDLKSILTLILTVGVVVFTAQGKIDPKDFMMLATMAFSFYFTYQNIVKKLK